MTEDEYEELEKLTACAYIEWMRAIESATEASHAMTAYFRLFDRVRAYFCEVNGWSQWNLSALEIAFIEQKVSDRAVRLLVQPPQ
jgi:hypothetical protein